MSIKPGSKPFNVVMTPSDKKRVMDAKNSVSRNKVNVPELKPETKRSTRWENECRIRQSFKWVTIKFWRIIWF